MRYGSTKKATDFRPEDWRVKVVKTVLFFIPESNPDFDNLFPKVKKWVIEVDDDGSPSREVAIDAEGRVLFCAPNGRNLGFWTDSDARFSAGDLTTMTAEQFEELWTKAQGA